VLRYTGRQLEQTPHLIAAELALLLITLVVGFAPLGPSPDEWVHARLRAEILRRERYLICARVGPYLAPPDLCVAMRKRLLALTNTIADPLDYGHRAASDGRFVASARGGR